MTSSSDRSQRTLCVRLRANVFEKHCALKAITSEWWISYASVEPKTDA